MPEYYDKNNCHGVKITVTPNNRLFKKHLKRFSRSIAVGEAVDLTLRLDKLDDFNAHFWEKRKVVSQLPNRNNKYAAEIEWEESSFLVKKMTSIRTDSTGEIYYRMPKVEFGIYDLNDDDTIPIYYSTVVDKSEIRRAICIGITMLLLGAFLSPLISALLGI